MEITDSGKFIEVEREAVDNSLPAIDKQEIKEQKSVTPNQSPAKSVRIKENGAKHNGDTDTLKVCFFLIFCIVFVTVTN